MQTGIPRKLAPQIAWYKRRGLIEVVHIDAAVDRYSEDDFAIAERTRSVARALVRLYVPSVLSESGYEFTAGDVSNISDGLELNLADRLYDKVRTLVAVLDECNIDRDDLWVDFGNWAFPNLRWGKRWWRNRGSVSPDYFNIVAKAPEFRSRLQKVDAAGFEPLSDTGPETLLLGRSTRSAYLAAWEAIGQAEERLGKRFGFLIDERSPGKSKPLKREDGTFLLPSGFYVNSVDLKLRSASLRFALPGRAGGTFVHAKLDKSSTEYGPGFGINTEIWFATLLTEMIEATNSRLAAIVSSYDCVMHHPYFSNVDTLICAPSRWELFIPIFLGLKKRGVVTIEYQAVFWADHFRYEVRDMDLFVCSDAATMKNIKRKYDATEHSTQVVSGPSFYMAEFLTDYAKAASQGRTAAQPGLVGLALQPIKEDIFEAACCKIRDAGFELLIRPHPDHDRTWIESRFGKYGTIDEGSLVDFIAGTSVVVSGFSNVVLQAAQVGKPAVCLPLSNQLGLNFADASERIHVAGTLNDLSRYLALALKVKDPFVFRDPLEEWCEIRRTSMPDQITAESTHG